MEILVIGAGVIGTVYGLHLAAAGHMVTVYSHGEREKEISNRDLRQLTWQQEIAFRKQFRL
jgi:ketopantoate reductase